MGEMGTSGPQMQAAQSYGTERGPQDPARTWSMQTRLPAAKVFSEQQHPPHLLMKEEACGLPSEWPHCSARTRPVSHRKKEQAADKQQG